MHTYIIMDEMDPSLIFASKSGRYTYRDETGLAMGLDIVDSAWWLLGVWCNSAYIHVHCMFFWLRFCGGRRRKGRKTNIQSVSKGIDSCDFMSFFVCFWEKASLYSPGWPWNHRVEPVSTSSVLRSPPHLEGFKSLNLHFLWERKKAVNT